ncbi:MAG TPA: DNA integrity scanning diadenylate cyclase DisA [Limnochordia bacterium]|nr:DNA integrity scanning diadenylate cyclase DisA [Limnochordia bacterium]
MKEERPTDDSFLRTLRFIAPGTLLHDALENILRARTGALIVIGDSPEVLELVDGGFKIDTDMTPSGMYELAKMDGAIILSSDGKRILYVNTQLMPNASIATVETGTRHRTAERVARQTGETVIAISQRRNVITIYRGSVRYVLRDVGVILAKANQAVSTLERYKSVLQQALGELSAVELEDLATLYDVATCLQRACMVTRIAREIERYVAELGAEGRLVEMQHDELMMGIRHEGLQIVRDYRTETAPSAQEIWKELESWDSDDLLELTAIGRALGHAASMNGLETPMTPRGYRILSKIPRLPASVIENLVHVFHQLPQILEASTEELDDVEGIGEVRAKAIQDGLRRIREQSMIDRHL